jgi:hypothetical protein
MRARGRVYANRDKRGLRVLEQIFRGRKRLTSVLVYADGRVK